MPHLSKKTLSKKVLVDLEQKLIAFISDASPRKRRLILKELLTQTERLMLAKRLGIIFLVSKGKTAYEISKILKVSDSTVFRFMKKIDSNKMSHTSAWLKNYSAITNLLEIIADLISVPIEARHKSLSKLIRER